MSGFNVKLTGVKELEGKLKGLTGVTKAILKQELDDFGLSTVRDAKDTVRVNNGFLKNHIDYQLTETKDGFKVEVIVAADYAAYVEFGTGPRAAKEVATLPPDWQTFAAQYKGKGGGTFDEFINRLVEWILKNKIGATYDTKTRRQTRVGKQSAATTAKADAYFYAILILKNGLRARPFLRPAVEKNKIDLIKNLKANL